MTKEKLAITRERQKHQFSLVLKYRIENRIILVYALYHGMGGVCFSSNMYGKNFCLCMCLLKFVLFCTELNVLLVASELLVNVNN